jgi:general secretion pathway protein I
MNRRVVTRGGFTLVEVLISLAMFALAAVVLGAAYVNVLLNYHAMQRRDMEKAEIAFVRTRVLAEPSRRRVEEGGDVALENGARLHWRAELDEMPVADLFEVNLIIEISPAGTGPARRETQTFRLLRPTWSDPEKRERLRVESRERLTRLRS